MQNRRLRVGRAFGGFHEVMLPATRNPSLNSMPMSKVAKAAKMAKMP